MKTLDLLTPQGEVLRTLRVNTERDPYVAYSYAYPHKSAYAALEPSVPLRPVWQAERRDALFLYVHIPFCEMRCGFCNLFTRIQADADLIDRYLATLARQARITADLLGDFTMVRFALGGGTPTFLSPRQLDHIFTWAQTELAVDPHRMPTSVETSPKTATADRLGVLLQRGVQRVSIGVQSFDDAEAHAIGRPQSAPEVHAALERLRAFPILNIDLIYGQPGQTVQSWLGSVRTALRYEPEELFLYPLYVRPGTGLARHGQVRRAEADQTRHLYRAARDLLLDAGYEQLSMRCFRWERKDEGGRRKDEKKADLSSSLIPHPSSLPGYCCQSDGMVGLGCGARSYTNGLHYSNPFAVEAEGVQTIIDDWIVQDDAAFRQATWGFCLTDDERMRRFIIQSLLQRDGLDEGAFQRSFGSLPEEFAAQLTAWANEGLVERGQASCLSWRLTDAGLELSDHLGPALYSVPVRSALEAFAWR